MCIRNFGTAQRVSTLTNAFPKLKFFGLDCSNLAADFTNPAKKLPKKLEGLDSHASFSATDFALTLLIDFSILECLLVLSLDEN